MFKGILNLFAETFLRVFFIKDFSYRIQFTRIGHEKYRYRYIFFKKGQLAGVTLVLSYFGCPSYFFKEIKNYHNRAQHRETDNVKKINKVPRVTGAKKIIEIVQIGATMSNLV